MLSTECPRIVDPNSTPLSLHWYCSGTVRAATNAIYIVNKTITKILDKLMTPGGLDLTKDTKHFFDVLPLESDISTSDLSRSPPTTLM